MRDCAMRCAEIDNKNAANVDLFVAFLFFFEFYGVHFGQKDRKCK